MSKNKRLFITKNDFDAKPHYDKYTKPIPITKNHKKYHNLLKDKSKKIVVCNGWAGTSKTISAMYYACQAVLNEEVQGIVIVKDMEDLFNRIVEADGSSIV